MSVGSMNYLIKKLQKKTFKRAETRAEKSKTRKTREETSKAILSGMGKKWKSDEIWYAGESRFDATGCKFDLSLPAVLPRAPLRLLGLAAGLGPAPGPSRFPRPISPVLGG